MYCTHCGKELDDRAVICVHCGIPVAPAVNVQPLQPAESAINGFTVTGFALSLVSIILGVICLIPALGLTFSLISVYRSREARIPNALGITGIVISSITLAFWVLFWLSVFIGFH